MTGRGQRRRAHEEHRLLFNEGGQFRRDRVEEFAHAPTLSWFLPKRFPPPLHSQGSNPNSRRSAVAHREPPSSGEISSCSRAVLSNAVSLLPRFWPFSVESC